MFRLLRYFSIASLVSLILATVVLSAMYRQIATQQLIELGESNNNALTQMIANAFRPQLRSLANAARQLDGADLRDLPEIAILHRGLMIAVRNTQVVKLKFYHLDGRTLFSSDVTQIGMNKSDNPGFIAATKGLTMNELTHRDKFSAFDREIVNRDMLSSYIPLRLNADAPVEGIIEVYTDVTDLLATIDQQQRTVTLSVIAALTLLYGTLFFIVQHADGIIKDQNRQQRLTELRIEHMAYHDALTDLPNRALLEDRIQQALTLAKRRGAQMAVVFIDLDHFKDINDSLGHHVGDQVLQAVAQRLSGCVRESDTIARIGGDEFVLCLSDTGTDADLSLIAQKLLDAISLPLVAGGRELHTTASIGIALYPEHGDDASTLLVSADTAMYSAKQLGRNKYQVFIKDMNQRMLQRLQLEDDIRHGLENNEFELHYQAMVDLESGAIVGAEALLRWRDAHGAWIAPEEFIPVAEECGLITPLSKWMLNQAGKQLQTWRECGLGDLTLAASVSPRQFASGNLAAEVAALIERAGIDPARLQLEIAESLLMSKSEAVHTNFKQLGQLGVRFSIADFGTGYSNLGYLRRFPVHMLKIDCSFIDGLPDNSDHGAIVTAVAAMTQSLGIALVAKGVETHAQLAFLKRIGCDIGQGSLFSQALPGAQLTSLILERRGMRAEA